MTPHVYVIGYNSQERIDRLYSTIPAGVKTTLIDNGTVPLEAPLGDKISTGGGYFTEGFNLALREAGVDEVPIILNDDLELEPGCIVALTRAIEDGYACAVPMQVQQSNPQMCICGGFGAALPAGQHRGGVRSNADICKKQPFRWVTFCAVAMNPATVKQIGLLDENMRMWFSDTDWCVRARWSINPATGEGWECLYEPAAVVRHENHAATNGIDDEKRQRMMLRDQAMFMKKWSGGLLEGLKYG